MRLLDDLQDGLARRHRQIVGSRRQNLGREVAFAANWIGKQPLLTAIIAEARHVEKPPPQKEWLAKCENEIGMVWPTETEEGRAVLSWNLLSSLHPDRAADLAFRIYRRSGTKNSGSPHEAFTPLFKWLTERLQYRSSVSSRCAATSTSPSGSTASP